MEKIKKLIIICGIIIFAIIFFLIFIKMNKDEQIESESIMTKEEDTSINGGNQEVFYENMEEVTNVIDYYAVKDIIDRFYTYIGYLDADINDLQIVVTDQTNTKEILQNYKNDGIEAIKQMLDKSYIEEFNVDNDKIYNYFKEYSNDSFYIKKMYSNKPSSNTNIVLVNGIMKNTNKEVKLLIKLDIENINFSIFPEEYIEKYNYTNDSTQVLINSDSIEENDYNVTRYINIDDSTLAQYYLKDYKDKISINIEMAYDVIDNEYKEKRFKSLENYKEYIQSNKDNIEKSMLAKYKVTEYDDYTEYVCIDNYGNYYVFKETAPMDYTVILDSYTIEIPEIVEKYNKSTTKEKVGININNIISALNNKDYSYIYEKLDTTFKENNYKTQKEFENYIKQNLYDQNAVEFEEYEDRSGTYIYKVVIKNEENESQTKDMTIVMQLKEGTDYVMSFSI